MHLVFARDKDPVPAVGELGGGTEAGRPPWEGRAQPAGRAAPEARQIAANLLRALGQPSCHR